MDQKNKEKEKGAAPEAHKGTSGPPAGAGTGSVQQNQKDHADHPEDGPTPAAAGTREFQSPQEERQQPHRPSQTGPHEQQKGGGGLGTSQKQDSQKHPPEPAPPKPGDGRFGNQGASGQLQGGSTQQTTGEGGKHDDRPNPGPGGAFNQTAKSAEKTDDKGKPIPKWESPGLRFLKNSRTKTHVDRVAEHFSEMNHEAAQDVLGATLLKCKANGVNQDLAMQIVREVYTYQNP